MIKDLKIRSTALTLEVLRSQVKADLNFLYFPEEIPDSDSEHHSPEKLISLVIARRKLYPDSIKYYKLLSKAYNSPKFKEFKGIKSWEDLNLSLDCLETTVG